MAGNRVNILVVAGPAGLNYFTNPELAFAEIIKVTREQNTLFKTSGTPTGNLFSYESGGGKITVDANNPFNFAVLNPDGSRMIEYCTVLYKRPTTIYVPPDGPSENP